MPKYVKRDNNLDVDMALRIIEELENNNPQKPWTVVSRVTREDEDSDDIRTNLRILTLKGYIMIDADGGLFVDNRMDFREDYIIE